MKSRFSTADIMAVLHDLQQFVGMRVNNVYDVDSKTYLIRLMKPDAKGVILFESGIRLHATEFDWTKSMMPSSFAMKLRKHIKQKRLERICQCGIDRIVEMQFGSGEVACHVFVELYDRGNVILTDYELNILNILRPRTDKDTDVRYAVREKYPVHLSRQFAPLTDELIAEIFTTAKVGDNLRKILNPSLPYGPALVEDCLTEAGFSRDCQLGKQFRWPEDSEKIKTALSHAEKIFDRIRQSPCEGYIIYKEERRLDGESVETFLEFHPALFAQHRQELHKQYPSFNTAVDEFFSKIEMQKHDVKALQQERLAVQKCEKLKNDHESRLKDLQTAQDADRRRAELIIANQTLVDRAILILRSAVANQLTWEQINDFVAEAKERGDHVASAIKNLNLKTSRFTLALRDSANLTGGASDDEDDEDDDDNDDNKLGSPLLVEIDLNSNAYQNACRYFDHKKKSAIKEQKTIDAGKKALKTAQSKMHETLKTLQVKTSVVKARKPFWFEKFLWFLSTDGYLVIGGRDAQQNELLVKRYLRTGDVYVHADIRGASSVVVKNTYSAETPISPKTLHEAGTMAVCCSAAWDAKVVTGAWWVNADQVSKTAPTGEYLTTGSFMIRGKKNFLPPCQLVMGFGILYRLDEESVPRHQQLLKLRREESATSDVAVTESVNENADVAEEIELAVDSDESDTENKSVQKNQGDGEDVPKNDASDEEEEFPDVAVKLKTLSVDSEDTTILQLGLRRPSKTVDKRGETDTENVKQEKEAKETSGQQPKRGQRQKLKKIKEKYKDQDDEEREMRMKMLASAGVSEKAKGKKASKQAKAAQPAKKQTVPQKKINVANPIFESSELSEQVEESPATSAPEKPPKQPEQEDDVPETEETTQWIDQIISAVDSLTGMPLEDDLLLFALPMCAPYTAMSSLKYKVKLTPGTGKKGKATKTALAVFLKDRTATTREKDLMKAMNDQDLSRNLPGKVKVSAPQLTAVKKQKS